MQQDTKKIIKIASLSFLLIFIVVYAFFRSKDLVLGVKIKDVNIEDGAKMEDSVLKITGNAKNALELKLNNREISINQQGDFEETIALLPGFNLVNIKARDEFGNNDEKNYKLMH